MLYQSWINPKIDRSIWGPGEWDKEVIDKVQWMDGATGLMCLAVRSEFGNWCGYVGVRPGHPLHGKGYEDADIRCHFGLTFAGACREGPPAHSICHIAPRGTPAHLWWLGFDCAHYIDYAPGLYARTELIMKQAEGLAYRTPSFRQSMTYRTLRYVKKQCRSMCTQIAAVNK